MGMEKGILTDFCGLQCFLDNDKISSITLDAVIAKEKGIISSDFFFSVWCT